MPMMTPHSPPMHSLPHKKYPPYILLIIQSSLQHYTIISESPHVSMVFTGP